MRTPSAPRGFTLIELVVVLGITGFVVAGITKAMIDLDKTANVRRLNTQLQGEGRDGMRLVEREIRNASLGTNVGVIWSEAAGNVVQDPAVQIFDAVPGGGFLDVKPGTDVLLVVGALPERAAALVGTSHRLVVNDPLQVSDTAGLAVGDAVLMGPYRFATWDRIAQLEPSGPGATEWGQMVLESTRNVFPGGRLASGSMIRRARARMYFVNGADELVRAELRVPRAPANALEVIGTEVLALAIENLQVGCELHDGVAFFACPPGRGGEFAAFGKFDAGTGPRLRLGAGGEPGDLANLRVVELGLVARSRRPVREVAGDPKIDLDGGGILPVGGAPDDEAYVRRAYRLGIAVRNTSLEVL